MTTKRPLFASLGLLLGISLGLGVLTLRPVAPPPTPSPEPSPEQLRPDLGGPEATYGTEHFLVHYTTQAPNAPPATDADGDGIPDYVERVGAAMEYAWEVQIERMGFAPPPTDGGLGGDERFDVYLTPISYFGYADSAGGVIGDNPFSEAAETRAAFSYMALDTTFEGYLKYGLTVEEALANTAVHEFSHSVQYGYDSEEEWWLLEATGAVIESLHYPNLHDNIGYLVAHTEQPDVCLPFVDETLGFDYHPYSHWYFLKYLVEHHPLGEKILPRLWAAARDHDGLLALDVGLAGELDAYWSDWVIANLARQDCPAGAPYCMAEATRYPPVAIEGRLTPFWEGRLNWDGTRPYHPPDGVGGFGVDYIDLTPYQAANIPLRLSLTLTPTATSVLAARLVGFHPNTPLPEIVAVPSIGEIVFDATQYARLYLTVENHTPVLEDACALAESNYTVNVTAP